MKYRKFVIFGDYVSLKELLRYSKYIDSKTVLFFDYTPDEDILSHDLFKKRVYYHELQQGIGTVYADILKFSRDNKVDAVAISHLYSLPFLSEKNKSMPKKNEIISFSRFMDIDLEDLDESDEYFRLLKDIRYIFKQGIDLEITDIHPPLMIFGKSFIDRVELDEFSSAVFLQIFLRAVFEGISIRENPIFIEGFPDIWIWEDKEMHLDSLRDYYMYFIDSELFILRNDGLSFSV